ncbi:MAG: pilin [Candidatus Paceibacterota bacterium]|jgi:uncharacterized membrane protein YidH (DUF202 family)
MNLFFTNIAYANDRLDSFISNVNSLIINPLIVLLFALALVYFLYGVFEFLSNQDSEEKKTAGKKHMIWGIIGLTIMLGVWFILGVILKTLNVEGIDPEKGTVELNDYAPNFPEVGN